MAARSLSAEGYASPTTPRDEPYVAVYSGMGEAAWRMPEMGAEGSNRGYDGRGSSGSMRPTELVTVLLDAFKTLLLESESYLHYYEQHFRLEEEHLRAVSTMLEKQRDADLRINHKLAVTPGLLPDVTNLSGLRNAWGDLRLSDMWVVDLRMKALAEGRKKTLQPIVQFRDAQERIRRRVKDGLRACLHDYNEMRDVTLPRIRKIYEKRCEETEFYKHQQKAIDEQRSLLATAAQDQRAPTEAGSDTIWPVQDTPALARTMSSPAISPVLGQEPAGVSAAAPAVTTSTQAPGRTHFLDQLRKKEGWDAAPKRLNALFTRMLDVTSEKPLAEAGAQVAATPSTDTTSSGAALAGPAMEAGLPPGTTQKSHQLLAVKQAKSKREVEEADRAYRKAIFDLETLRIRLNKTLGAAVSSLLEWRRELSVTMQRACLQHVRDSMALHTSMQASHQQDEQMAEHMLDHLDAEQQMCEDWMPNTRSLIQEQRVQYVNYWHGPYKDLIFGTGLVDYAFSHGDAATASTTTETGQIVPAVRPPLIVSKCIQYMELPRSLSTPGIYRLSAKYSRIQELTSAIEQDESRFQFDPDREDPVMVASILKQYLRQLPEPVMGMRWEERIKYTHERDEHVRNGFTFFKSRIRRMPPIHQATLRALLMHLAKVAAHADKNKMTVSNLATIFSPVVLSELESTSLAAAAEEDHTMADLITYCGEIFSVPPGRNSPLPPVPGEKPSVVSHETTAHRRQAMSWDSASAPLHQPHDVLHGATTAYGAAQ